MSFNLPGPDYWLFFYCREKIDNLRRRNAQKHFFYTKLSMQNLYNLYREPICVYCGKECIVEIIDQSSNKLKHNSATIDRVNPLIGYDDSNIVIACHKCNQKKGRKDQILVERFGRKIKVVTRTI